MKFDEEIRGNIKSGFLIENRDAEFREYLPGLAKTVGICFVGAVLDEAIEGLTGIKTNFSDAGLFGGLLWYEACCGMRLAVVYSRCWQRSH